MSNSIKIEQNVVINPERDTAVQTALTGNYAVYSLPKWTSKRSKAGLIRMIMDDDGPLPMFDMRPAKKTRNAADQFYDEHHGEYEAMGQGTSQIERVHNHNNACPKMYEVLDRRRSIARVGMTGLAYQTALRGSPPSCSKNMTAKFDPTCPKCIKRKKRIEEERKRKGPSLCKKCREKRSRREKNNLGRVTKQKIAKPRKQETTCRSFSRTFKPCIIRSSKGFQCQLTAQTKSVSTCKSSDNLYSVPNSQISVKDNTNQGKIVSKSKLSIKKRGGKKLASVKSDVNSVQPDMETTVGTSRTSYNSFMSMEHEPMVE